MPKHPISQCWKIEKLILDPDKDPDQFQNPIDWSLAESLNNLVQTCQIIF